MSIFEFTLILGFLSENNRQESHDEPPLVERPMLSWNIGFAECRASHRHSLTLRFSRKPSDYLGHIHAAMQSFASTSLRRQHGIAQKCYGSDEISGTHTS